MATGPQIQVIGARELRRALNKAGDDAEDLKNLNQRLGEVVAAEARNLVPRRTGALADSIRAARQKAAAVVRAGKLSVPYAGPIHFGWPERNIKPQPFLYDAIDKRRSDVIRLYEQRIEEIARKVENTP